MSIWRVLLELGGAGMIGGFIGYLASMLIARPGTLPDDVKLTADEFAVARKVLGSKQFQNEVGKAIWIAAAASGIAVRAILLLL